MAYTCPINKLEKILLSTDGSEFSEGAVKEAIKLAGQCSSTLFVMTVVEANEEYASEAPKLVEKAEIEAGEILQAVKARADEAGVACEVESHTGISAYETIVNVAKSKGCELIIMGRRGRTGLARVAMGSVTAKVIGHAPCDILVVPREGAVDYLKILVATDGSSHGEAAGAEAIRMAAKTGGSIVALSVASSASKAEAAEMNVMKIKQMAMEEGIACETLTATGKHYVQIVEAAQEVKADLIAIGCHGKGGLSRLLMGSVTERVIGHATCAVLVACGS
ncbi:MAG: universal stress protein [Thermoleophilia bacterium]|nr:universal stress protein [Thermoleophilia bacterium]